jgi:hypothetical protein
MGLMRPFEKIETSKIRFLLGVAEAGVASGWKGKEIKVRIEQMKDELKQRGERM